MFVFIVVGIFNDAEQGSKNLLQEGSKLQGSTKLQYITVLRGHNLLCECCARMYDNRMRRQAGNKEWHQRDKLFLRKLITKGASNKFKIRAFSMALSEWTPSWSSGMTCDKKNSMNFPTSSTCDTP